MAIQRDFHPLKPSFGATMIKISFHYVRLNSLYSDIQIYHLHCFLKILFHLQRLSS